MAPRRCLAALCLTALGAAGCAARLYEGEPRSLDQVSIIQVGSTIVRIIDGEPRRGGVFDASEFEVLPGTHRITLVFQLPARTVGVKTLPAQAGEGTCELVFAAVAGTQYYLGARPTGETMSAHWEGTWEAWVRDPTVGTADDIVARCSSQPGPDDVASGVGSARHRLTTHTVPLAAAAAP